eukprot:CAMPEP_0170614986 /NCGR_PEP_ID=MMETSP0224-20130122/25095_1 /TAXON_ID=285029 /ORGANISM="Togula jolla, Strain CCCM 725" /LENGTH=63 /DNA_ID=CAMNT_0010940685 /DNA_START=687 /DNA_END=876 /DNA_ORIENTATION=-
MHCRAVHRLPLRIPVQQGSRTLEVATSIERSESAQDPQVIDEVLTTGGPSSGMWGMWSAAQAE